jgi:hypothetical protein
MLPNICSRYERMRCSRIKQHNCRSVIEEKHTNDNIRSFLRFFHGHMIDSHTGVVLLGSNRNRVGSIGRARCSYSVLIGMSVQIGALVNVMSIFTTIRSVWVPASMSLRARHLGLPLPEA